MEDSPKRKRTVPWITAATAILVAYPLSLWPVVWLAEKADFSQLSPGAKRTIENFYLPLGYASIAIPFSKPIQDKLILLGYFMADPPVIETKTL